MRFRRSLRSWLVVFFSVASMAACAGGVDQFSGDDGGPTQSPDAAGDSPGHVGRDATGDEHTSLPESGDETVPADGTTGDSGDAGVDVIGDDGDATIDGDDADANDASDASDSGDSSDSSDSGDAGLGNDCAVMFPNNLYVQNGSTDIADGGASPDDATAPAQAANLLDLDFGSTTTAKGGVAAAGASAGDVWNAVGPGSQSDYLVTGLLWADGSSSNVELRVTNLPGNWGLSSAIGDPMYDNYAYSWSGSSASITFVNLPAGSYDFYVYSSVTGGNTGSSVSACLSGVATPMQFTSTTAFATDTTWIAGDEYALHAGLAVGASDVVTMALANGTQGTGNAGILVNGIQLVRH